MTEQERLAAFQEALQDASKRYGVDVFAVAQSEQLGAVVQVRAVIRLQAREDWTDDG